MSQTPKELVRAFLLEVRSGKAPHSASTYMAPNVTANQVVSEATVVIKRTPAEYAEHVIEMKSEFGEFEFQIDELIADEDRVYARWTQIGNGVTEVASCVYQVESGLIVEYWIQIDRLGVQLQQAKLERKPAQPAIQIEDPRTPDVSALLQRHLDFCRSVPPEGQGFALDIEKLRRPGITLFGAREDGVLVGVCALKLLSDNHAELKSMHVLSSNRGRGVGGMLISHILEYARAAGLARVSLETSPHNEFASARRLYAMSGFELTSAFADYPDSPLSVFMSLNL